MNPTTLCVGCMEIDSGEPVCTRCGRPFDLPPKNVLQLKPRTVLRDQYVIGRALGHGGFGITYLAWDMGLESRLAIKEYMPNGVAGRGAGQTTVLAYSEQAQPEFEWGLDRFLDEARVLKRFDNHPTIVHIDTAFRENGTAYLVMEYLNGVTFEEFLKRRGGRIPLETALRVIFPVIDALRDVHAEGILHRDVSPDNIYLTNDGKIKLIDFGAARNALGQKSRNLSIILKEGYAPEEQYRASGVQGPWTDVYATAATLYHALTGAAPPSALDRLAEDTLQRPTQLGVEIDPAIEAALMRALSARSNDRFQSMEDFKAALSGAGSGAPPPPQVHAPPPPAAPLPAAPLPSAFVPPPPAPIQYGGGNTDNKKWIWPAALAGVAVLSIAAALYLKPSGDLPKQDPKKQEKQQDSQPDPQQKGPTPEPFREEPKQPEPLPNSNDNKQPQPQRQDNKQPNRPDNRQPDTRQPDNRSDNRPPQRQDNPERRNPDSDPNPNPNPGFDRNPNTQPLGGYDETIAQAKRMADRNPTGSSQLLARLIQSEPEKPAAYNALAEIQLYRLRQLGPAVQNYKTALAKGGEATFEVMHDHSGTNFVSNCHGWLHVTPNAVRFEGFDSLHKFSATRNQIKEAKGNRWQPGGLLNGRGRPTLDANSFHIKMEGNKGANYNLAPLSDFKDNERQLILDIIDKK